MGEHTVILILWTAGSLLGAALVLHLIGRRLEHSSHTWLFPNEEPDAAKRAAFKTRMRRQEALGNRLMTIAAWIYAPILGGFFLISLGLGGAPH